MVARDSIRALIKQTGFGFFFVYILSQGSTNKIERDPFGTVDAPREASGKENKISIVKQGATIKTTICIIHCDRRFDGINLDSAVDQRPENELFQVEMYRFKICPSFLDSIFTAFFLRRYVIVQFFKWNSMYLVSASSSRRSSVGSRVLYDSDGMS